MNKRLPMICGLLFVLASIWLSVDPPKLLDQFINRMENLSYDLQLRILPVKSNRFFSSPVIIVDIDDKSLKALGRWPWSRDKIATLIKTINDHGTAMIALDIFFSEQEDNIAKQLRKKLAEKQLLDPRFDALLKSEESSHENDSILSNQIKLSPIVLPLSFLHRKETINFLPPPFFKLSQKLNNELDIIHAQGYISNIPILQDAAKASGFINIYPDADGIVRRAPLVMVYQLDVYPALSLQTIAQYLKQPIELVTELYGEIKKVEGVRVGNTVIPLDAQGQMLIPFVGKSYTFPYYSAIDILSANFNKDIFQNKIVIIGTSATGLGDLHPTAIQNPFPGVEVQATLIHAILNKNFFYQPEWAFGATIAITLLLGIIFALSFPYCGPKTLGMIILIFPFSILSLNYLIWQKTGLVLFLFSPIFLGLLLAIFNILYGYLFETRRRERLKEMFGQYVPEKHIDKMLTTTSDYGLQGEDREMTVLFSDIRNFTTLSEGSSAKEIVETLNAFFTPMTEIVFKHKGTIDKYVGDLIMAFWGAPLLDQDHALHAMEASLEMQKKVIELQPHFSHRGWQLLKIGVGINSGMMSIGDMGSKYRRNYTVIGDTVNLASRIEGLTKFYGVNIIVTESTIKNQKNFVVRKLDHVKVKGKQQSITIYELICKKQDLTPPLSKELELYQEALHAYFQMEWDMAFTTMNALHQKYPERKLYKVFLERIEAFKQAPPPADWDGSYILHSK